VKRSEHPDPVRYKWSVINIFAKRNYPADDFFCGNMI